MKLFVKRVFDVLFSFIGLILILPVMIPTLFLVWVQDFKSPFYIAERVGRNFKVFKMIKIRSMVINADKSGVLSTSSSDTRITPIGKFIRKFKLDELSQLINVLLGDMSLVGPRPNVLEEVKLYSEKEKKLLTYRPGITDISSIVFSDEGDILKDSKDPDLDYNQLIRPGKGYLGIFYIENNDLLLDIKLCCITLVAVISKNKALFLIGNLLKRKNAPPRIIEIAMRKKELIPMPPPGLDEIVKNR